jgi:hypothetical protein
MPCPFISKIPMTDAERQARYRTMHADGAPIIRIRRPADRRSRIRSQNDTIAALTETPAGVWRLAGCAAGQSTTAPRRRPCGRLSNSIFPSFWRSNHRVVSAVIEQWDGLNGIGHDDAWKGGRHQPVAV